MFAFTRKYSALKKITVLHHVLMPAALALTPVYGSLIVHGSVLPLAWVSSVAILLGDINMNVVGAFKDLWDDSAKERVLPLVIGPRPSIVVALLAGVGACAAQIGAIAWGWASAGALVPIAIALALTVWSRIRLYREPSAKVGYASLKAGRLSECFGFPALIAGVLPLGHALALILGLVLLAWVTQTLISENILPPQASHVIDGADKEQL
jgi:4-hydroxybenzoate polyprenyltransferase